MCLIIDKGKRIKIAKADITCYKVLSIAKYEPIGIIVRRLEDSDKIMKFNSNFRGNFTYNKGVVAESEITKLKPSQHFAYFDDKENLDYGDLHKVYYENDNYNDEGKKAVLKLVDVYSEGLHSALTLERIDSYGDFECVICECTIPKGSKYLQNKSDLFISNKLIVNKIVKTNLEAAKKKLADDRLDLD